jgi:hypothetical protein
MKVRGIVVLSLLAVLAVVAVACGGAEAEVKVDKGLAAYAGANLASVQQDAGESARSAASTGSGSEVSYEQPSASAPVVNQAGLGGSALTRDATSSGGAALAPLEQAGPLGIVVQGYGRATATADTARVEFMVSKSGDRRPSPRLTCSR